MKRLEYDVRLAQARILKFCDCLLKRQKAGDWGPLVRTAREPIFTPLEEAS